MIFFDIDDTLLDNQGAEIAAAIELHQLYSKVFPEPPDEFAYNWRMITEKYFQRYLAGELSFQGQRRERLKEIFSHDRILTDNEADNIFQKYHSAYKRNWRLFPDVEPCLAQLSGIKLGIISNSDSSQQMQKLIATGIRERFSVVVISGDVGVSKPDARIFWEACRTAGVSPSECWHIGDNFEADYKGSLSAGLNGIWLNRDDTDSVKGVEAIKSLSEVKRVIRMHKL